MTGRFDWALAIQAPWLIFVTYWFLASLRVNKMERREPGGEVLVRIILTLAAFFLLRENDPRFGVLNRRFIPWQPWVFVAAAACTWAGVAFAIWARHHIGKYWSGTVALRAGHELIRTGPYTRIRHPIYTGILLALAGTGLAVGRYRALVAFAIILLSLIWKSKREEALLANQFGAAFEEHRRRTGFFLPKFS
jgi:protein-S-isoprenylcysteine O-methyltransferase Ste14